jgi:hypothetical protein
VNPAELKKLLRPLVKELVKESVQEVLIKEGLLSTVVSEVAKGMSGNMVTESRKSVSAAPVARDPSEEQKLLELKRQKKELLDAIGKDSFRGVDIFEGVSHNDLPSEPTEGALGSPLAGTSPNDPGIDISSIVAMGGNAWNALVKGKTK